MIKDIMDKIIKERKEKELEDDYGKYECWDKMVNVLSKDVNGTIQYLESCSEEDIYYISEVFDDISEQLQSARFIECIEQLAVKYPDLNLEVDIMYAKKSLK